jgi:hypothetical protein
MQEMRRRRRGKKRGEGGKELCASLLKVWAGEKEVVSVLRGGVTVSAEKGGGRERGRRGECSAGLRAVFLSGRESSATICALCSLSVPYKREEFESEREQIRSGRSGRERGRRGECSAGLRAVFLSGRESRIPSEAYRERVSWSARAALLGEERVSVQKAKAESIVWLKHPMRRQGERCRRALHKEKSQPDGDGAGVGMKDRGHAEMA